MIRKDIGVGLKPPENKCEDPKCAWHGSTAVRGRIFEGIVKTAKAQHTVVVQWEHNIFVPKYERNERRRGRVNAHNPVCIKAKEGDKVRIAESKPLSKTKSFVVVGLL